MRRLSVFVTVAVVAGSVVMFSAIAVLGYRLCMDLAATQAHVASEQVADEVSARLVQYMECGASSEQIRDMVRSAARAGKERPDYRVDLHSRIAPGHPELQSTVKEADPDVREVMESGEERTVSSGDTTRFLNPVTASKSCLSCHAFAKAGDMFAVIEVAHDSGPVLAAARSRIIVLLLLLFPLPLLGGLLVARLLTARIGRGVETLRRCAEKVNESGDFDAECLKRESLGFSEFDALLSEVTVLADAVKGTARDQALQVKVLESLMLSGDAVRDWREEVTRMVAAMRRTMPVQALAAAFVLPDGTRELFIIWAGDLAEGAREQLARGLLDRLGLSTPESNAKVIHKVALPGNVLVETDPAAVARSSVIKIMEAPGVGGVLGAALVVEPGATHSPVLLSNTLGPVVNVLGALKAMDQYTRQIEYNATRDGLTNMYNQRMFWDLLGYEVERSKRHGYRFTLLVLDLDGFKQVNDSYGHAFGDEFLQAIGKALRRCSRAEDIVARYGGDEFVLVASNAQAEHGKIVARRLLDCVAKVRVKAPDGTEVGTGASIGMAVFPDHAADARELFLRADETMYKAKKAGKGRYFSAGE